MYSTQNMVKQKRLNKTD